MVYSVPLRPGQLLALRSAVVGGLVLALAVSDRFLERAPSAFMLAGVTLALTLFNAAAWWPLRRVVAVGLREVQRQLFVDVAVLAFFFYFAGGATHPFIDLFLLPTAIAAVSLPLRPALVLSIVAAASYLALVKWHVPLPGAREGVTGFQCFAMWLKYALCGAFVAYLLHGVARAAGEREAQEAREGRRREQDEYLAHVGSLAASAAHEMATPLCSISVVVHEILQGERQGERQGEKQGEKQQGEKDCSTHAALRLVAQQVDACRRLLGELLSYGRAARGEGVEGAAPLQAADRFVHELVERWRLLRPGAVLAFSCSGSEPAPAIPARWGLGHAVLNLLNNAADASPEAVELRCQWTPAELRIEVLDRGAGLPAQVLAGAGERCMSTKREKGNGLGLMLARNVVERAGGRFALDNRPDGGARALLVLPLPADAPAGAPDSPRSSHGFVVHYHRS